MEGRPLTCLGREEVPALLAGQPGHDDAADPHRSGARQGFSIDPGIDDEDRPGHADVETTGAEAAVWLGGQAQPTAGGPTEDHDATDAAPGGPDRDRGARTHVADDTRHRRLERVDDVASGDAPACPPREQVLPAVRPAAGAPATGPDDPAEGVPAVARAWLDGLGDDLVLEPRVTQALSDRGADHDRRARFDDGPVARREGEDGIDGRLDQVSQRHELEVRGGSGGRRRTLGIADADAGMPTVTHRAPLRRRSTASRRAARDAGRPGRAAASGRPGGRPSARPARPRRRPRNGVRGHPGGRCP